MYCIRKFEGNWTIKNNYTGASKKLNETEVEELLAEFPHLRESKNVTYFRNKVKSITDLP
ncbi:MAG: hypothetical protein AAF696_19705 [Bacteroidota bacterium]